MATIKVESENSTALQMSGVLFPFLGKYFSGRAAQQKARYEADMADTNARISELAAQSALSQGQQQIGALTLKAGQLKSSQRARLAANGVDLGVGSAAELQAGTDLMKEVDTATLQTNALRAAWGYRTQGVDLQNQALVKRAEANSASPLASALGPSLLQAATLVDKRWYKKPTADTGNTNAGADDPIWAKGQLEGWWG